MVSIRTTGLIVGNTIYPATLSYESDKIVFQQSHFNLKDEIKAMKGARWNPDSKTWHVANCPRNHVAISYLEGKGPFKRYMIDLKTKDVRKSRIDNRGTKWDFYQHQIHCIQHGLVRHNCIVAAQMGLGKSLIFFEINDQAGNPETWYVGPKSAIASVQLDAWKWRFRGNITYMTYDECKSRVVGWQSGSKPPPFICFDESSKLKTPGSQRTQAAEHLANSIREEWGEAAYILLMSGSPAPKSPADWYQQCEIAAPGFIKEGDIYKFQRRLAVFQEGTGIGGQSYQKLVAWKDGNKNLCGICGQGKDYFVHTELDARGAHSFVPMTDEVSALYNRLSGLVMVKLKDQCVDLPAKVYRRVAIQPSVQLMRGAAMVKSQSATAIQALTNLRQLSDGFMYKQKMVNDDDCLSCLASGSTHNPVTGQLEVCPTCSGTTTRSRQVRTVEEVASPKLDKVTELLDEIEDTGRCVFYAGFTASIDRLCAHIKKCGWQYICVDGRGWRNSYSSAPLTPLELLKEFQDPDSKLDKLAFIGHPGSAGMGLTLTRSSMLVYVSNTFNAEERIQSEDRCHRLGMDPNRGCTIVDLVLLPTDDQVLKNLRRKRDLLSMTLGEVVDEFDEEQR